MMENKISILNIGLCLVLILGLSANCRALGSKITTEEMVEKSETIIQGKVVQKYQPDPNVYKVKVVIEVKEIIKGSSSPEISFEIPGGVVNGKGVKYSNMPLIKKDDDLLLFLSKEKARFPIVGWNQGCLHLKGGMIQEKGVRSQNFISEIKRMARELQQ